MNHLRQFGSVAFENHTAEVPQDLCSELVARKFSLMAPLITINRENSITEKLFTILIIVLPLRYILYMLLLDMLSR